MRIRDEACYNSKNRKRVDFHVSGGLSDFLFVERDEGVVFFVDIKVLNDAFFKEVWEVLKAQCQVIDVLLGEHRLAVRADNQWSHQSASIRSDVDTILLGVKID